MKALLFSILLLSTAAAQIQALFKTSVGDFTVRLDHVNAPLATANFMLLAGIPEEAWAEQDNLDTPAFIVPYSPLRPGNIYRQFGRMTLNVVWKEALSEDDVARYIIRLGNTVLGEVNASPDSAGTYRDLSGRDIIEIRREIDTNNFTIHINHRRRWLDNQSQTIRDAPMYRNLQVTQVDSGRRFFAGTTTNNPAESVGYRFPDEVAPSLASIPPWGNHFNSGWVLAMDNRENNSNGSRFFITGLPLPGDLPLTKEWNRIYTPLGEVLTNFGGRNVINTILNSSTDENGVPGANINISTIEISRLGGTDQGFFPHLIQDELPGEINNLPLRFERNDSRFELVTPPTPSSQQIFLTSTDLQSDKLIFFTDIPPFNFEETRQDLTPGLESVPKAFFEAYSAQLPHWPSKEFNFSGASLRFHNVTATGTISGSLILNLNDLTEENPNAFTGTFSMALPAKTIEMQDGTVTNFPQFNFAGNFSASYLSDADPYSARILFNDINTHEDFPFTFINLSFDYRLGTLLDQRISRFTAGSTETGYGIEGVWQKTN